MHCRNDNRPKGIPTRLSGSSQILVCRRRNFARKSSLRGFTLVRRVFMFVQGCLTFKFDKSSTNLQCFIFQFGGLGALFGKAKPTKAPVATGLCRRRAGARLQRRHTHAVFEYGCEIDRIVTGDTQTCALGAASASIPLLFKSLLPNCKPMLVKSRNFNLEDREVLIKSFPSFKRRYHTV